MELEKLQLDLHPRPHSQALDLGLALLRAHAGTVYKAWLAVWLPLIALCGLLGMLFPDYATWWVLLIWWIKPLLERLPLYILSRQVFGENVTWYEAVRAWPKQLRGGWFALLTWWRPFSTARALYQPIWQLEGARGKVAAERKKIIGADGTGRSAFWFGIACAHFEMVLQIGLFAFLGIFLNSERELNPFSYLENGIMGSTSMLLFWLTLLGYGISEALIGPVYAACGFTLYLNRRATLEAWDIEIVLRQIRPPAKARRRTAATLFWPLVSYSVPAILVATLLQPAILQAADTSNGGRPKDLTMCGEPEWIKKANAARGPDQNAEQAKLRQEVARLFQHEDLRLYQCEESWHLKNPWESKSKSDPDFKLPHLPLIAKIIQILLIASAVCLIGWLLYRYRQYFGALKLPRSARVPTEVAGLDIRPESLPDNVTGAVLALWNKGKHRAALALLYRATVSKLANEDGVVLTEGATEHDCLRLAKKACKEERLSAPKLEVAAAVTDLWLQGAYGNRWPSTDTVTSRCAAWQAQFDAANAHKAVQS